MRCVNQSEELIGLNLERHKVRRQGQSQNFPVCLLHFVATLRHDNNCCSHHQ